MNSENYDEASKDWKCDSTEQTKASIMQNHITNDSVRDTIRQETGLIWNVKKKNL